jgi:hypothetical protein
MNQWAHHAAAQGQFVREYLDWPDATQAAAVACDIAAILRCTPIAHRTWWDACEWAARGSRRPMIAARLLRVPGCHIAACAVSGAIITANRHGSQARRA